MESETLAIETARPNAFLLDDVPDRTCYMCFRKHIDYMSVELKWLKVSESPNPRYNIKLANYYMYM